jgi:hypothetical protein
LNTCIIPFFLSPMKSVAFLVTVIGLALAGGLRAQSLELNPDGARMARFDTWYEPSADVEKGGEVEFFQVRLGSPLYAHRSGEYIWGIRASYEFTSLDLSNDALAESSFHRMDIGPALVYLPEGSPWRAFAFGGVGLATDFTKVNSEDVIYSLLAAVGYKFSDSFTLLAGGYYSQDFGDAQIFPGVGFIWDISQRWTMSLLPPRARLSFAPNDSWRFAIEGYPDGGGWSVEAANGQQASLERKAWRAGARIEHKIANDGWAYVGGGWAFGRELRLEEEGSGRLLLESDVDGGAFVAVGVSFGF